MSMSNEHNKNPLAKNNLAEEEQQRSPANVISRMEWLWFIQIGAFVLSLWNACLYVRQKMAFWCATSYGNRKSCLLLINGIK